jgi:hypothetical protein
MVAGARRDRLVAATAVAAELDETSGGHNAGVDEVILRTIVIQFDGRVVEVFGVSGEARRGHVALMQEPRVGKPDTRGRSEVILEGRFGVDADELPKLLPLLDKITAAIRAAQAEPR